MERRSRALATRGGAHRRSRVCCARLNVDPEPLACEPRRRSRRAFGHRGPAAVPRRLRPDAEMRRGDAGATISASCSARRAASATSESSASFCRPRRISVRRSRDFVANHPRYVRGASTYLIDWEDDALLVGHRVHYPGLRGSAPFSAGAIAFGRAIFAELCGVEPTSRAPLPAAARGPCRPTGGRSAGRNSSSRRSISGSSIPRAALARPIPTADARAPCRHPQVRRGALELPAARYSRSGHARPRPFGAGGVAVPEGDRRDCSSCIPGR